MALPVEQFCERVASSGLLSAAELREFMESLPVAERPADTQQLARLLVGAKLLTAYQAQEVYKGNGSGLVLGNYVILDKLGQGGMGLVLKARHKRMDRIVALKVLSPAFTKKPESLQRFHREVKAAARLTHPNIVIAYDADEAAGTHFLVMEFVDGADLATQVKRSGPLAVDKALHCVLQAARGLEFAHEQGVVHRDIKPANLLLDAKGNVKVLDMGLARLDSAGPRQDDLTGTGQIMGTVDYMAPEQAVSTKNADARADIYSLGVTLWYLLTGRVLFDGESTVQVLMAHQTRPVPSLREACEGVSEPLAAVFEKMVAKTPDARFASMSEVIAALEACRGGASPASSSSGTAREGEDSKLSEFFRNVGPQSRAGSLPAASPATLTKTERGADADANIDVPRSQVDTDPETQQSLPKVNPLNSGVVAKPVGFTGRPASASAKSASKRTTQKLLISGGVVAAVLLVAVLGVSLLWPTNQGMVSIEILTPDTVVRLDDNADTIVWPNNQKLKLKPGAHELTIKHGKVKFTTEKFELKKGETVALKVGLLDGELRVSYNGRLLVSKGSSPETGGPSPVPPSNHALEFDGKTSYVEIATLERNQLEPLTLEAWVRSAKPAAILVRMEGAAAAQIYVSNNGSLAGGETDSLQSLPLRRYVSAASRLPANALTHVAYVVDARAAKLFVNGVRVATAPGPFKPSLVKAPFRGTWLGAHPKDQGGFSNLFQGVLDEVRISKVARYDNDFTPDIQFTPDNNTLALYHCDEGSGNVLNDSSGNKHHGKIVGAKWVSAEKNAAEPRANYALQYDGKSTHVTIPSLRLETDQPVTIEARVKFDKAQGATETVTSTYSSKSALLLCRSNGTTPNFLARRDLRSNFAGLVGELPNDEWLHVAGVWDGNTAKLFVNGRLQAAASPKDLTPQLTTPQDQPLLLGADRVYPAQPTGGFFHGLMDEVRISRIARYTGEFAPDARLTADKDTLALYLFDEGAGDVLNDSSGNKHHGKIVGAKWVRNEPASIDLLALVDPAKHALDPGVRKVNGVLLTPKWNNANTRVVVPFEDVPEEYDLRLVAERRGEDKFGLNLGLIVGGRQCVLDMDGGAQGMWCVSRIDGKGMHDGNVTNKPGRYFQMGRKSTVEVQVRRSGIRVLRDGEKIIDWQGRPDQLSLWDKIVLPNARTLFFFSQAEFAIHELRLTPLSAAKTASPANTQPSSPTRTAAATDRAVAEWVLLVGGSFMVRGGATIKEAKDLPPDPIKIFLLSLGKKETPVASTDLLRLKDLDRLGILILNNRQLSQEVLRGLAALPELYELNLGNASLNDAMLAGLAGNSTISRLFLHYTAVTDAGLLHLEKMPNLWWLNLSHTELGDSSLDALARFSRLRDINLEGTKVTQEGLNKLSAAIPKCRIRSSFGPLGPELPMRAVATEMLAAGCDVTLMTREMSQTLTVIASAKLPPEEFSLTVVTARPESSLGDEELARLGEIPTLNRLNATGAKVTDAGLPHLYNLSELRSVSFKATAVSDEGARKLSAALPRCRIEWSRGLIDPKRSGTSD